MSEKDLEKKSAAEKATEFVEDGMIVGLGSGSTVFFAIKKLGELVKGGLKIKGVSTSDSTTKLAGSCGIELISLNDLNKKDDVKEIDLTIDGADEVDKNLNGIKGGGGALLFEKIVALHSKKNIWIADSGKLVKDLGKYPLPVEVIPFGYKRVFEIMKGSGYDPEIRKKEDGFYLTDSGNYIFDLHLKKISNPAELNEKLKLINGVVETGLFINIADILVTGNKSFTEIIEK